MEKNPDGTRPTTESDRTLATVSFPLKSALRSKATDTNVAENVIDGKNVPVNDNEGKNGANNGAKSGAKKTPRQEAIMTLMANNPTITLDEIAKQIGFGTSTVDREISKMAHLVHRTGSKKGGHWEIINN